MKYFVCLFVMRYLCHRLREHCRLSQQEPWPKKIVVHFKAVKKPLVAIILNILSTMFCNYMDYGDGDH